MSRLGDFHLYPHAQRNRLEFIDFCLYYFGEVSKTDLLRQFAVGSASCTRDLALYRELAPENLEFKHQTKRYHITQKFVPLFNHEPETLLSRLSQGMGEGVKQISPPGEHCVDAIRLIHPDSNTIATLMRAITQRRAISVRYHSLSSGETERELVPHVLVNNGHRWHVRAYDRRHGEFRDFVTTRLLQVHELAQAPNTEQREADLAWQRQMTLTLVPHPALVHPEAIALDYGMTDGQLTLTVREALVGYLLQQWRVDCSPDARLDPRSHPLRLANHDVVATLTNCRLLPGVAP
ncbi:MULTISPECIES: helix-turn-helix transcriptional regulator [Shewanella]|uniref:helix-turn-helix transcriptional regulator n=1 Tax=Shewanella TaxID=22 RepID=UPI0021BF20ED|nr:MULTISPECIES: WYL domain-containing protein [Shewanella]MCU8041100.1 WYL domain-containing protein [Shewanella sp. SM69]MCU8093333.1 WYL domain-containing protein [Shewanella sp. SM20]MCU8106496.1 WYL domain-containing protein [Shewanella sp. SM101]UXK09925.1 WYL domain-containing protein [Shewanella putrefaciens]